MAELTWEKLNQNYVLHGDGFYVSYLSPEGLQRTEKETGGIYNMLGGLFGFKTGREETALKGPDGKWRILNGDFRKEYEVAVPLGFAACVEVFERHQDMRSDWSTSDV